MDFLSIQLDLYSCLATYLYTYKETFYKSFLNIYKIFYFLRHILTSNSLKYAGPLPFYLKILDFRLGNIFKVNSH